ncbi:transglycosylase SLT domain-containing protein [Acetobacter orientalis]|uniref:transglycosylase SLT domain-containing protein n=1 Tax=Acetobacter orientalis TaxID=146474 RepID=UPI0039ED812D
MDTVFGKMRKATAKRQATTGLYLGLLATLAACANQPARTTHTAAAGASVNHWSGYIQEASNRFSIPQSWIRAVMQQESGGHQYLHGRKIRSVHGAVGLMQIKPDTYSELAQRYSLGSDPYDPHDNIMAGSGYIRELYDRFGSPDFLAAYNCGPQCAENHRSKGTALPGYAKAYMAAISPHLNDPVPGLMQPTQLAYAPAPTPPVTVVADTSGPAADPPNSYNQQNFATGAQPAGTAPPLDDEDLSPPTPYGGAANSAGTITVANAQPTASPQRPYYAYQQPNNAPAYTAPTPQSTWRPTAPVGTLASSTGGGAIQIGAFSTQARAIRAASLARRSSTALANAVSQIDLIAPSGNSHPVWRTRLAGLPAQQTSAICATLRQQGLSCVPVAAP